MHRRMLALMALLAATLSISPAHAQTPCGFASCIYLALIRDSHIIPPPPISGAATQRVDLDPTFFYTVEAFREVPNSEAAQGYKNPKQALIDFAAQGRELSFLAQYSNTRARFIIVQDQVYRYATPDGAAAGQAYTAAEQQRDHPDFVPFAVPLFDGFGAPTIQLMRQQVIDGVVYYQYFISVQIGRYVTEIQLIGQSTSGRAIEAAIPTVDRLKAFPQT
jgi:hypothetical protein